MRQARGRRAPPPPAGGSHPRSWTCSWRPGRLPSSHMPARLLNRGLPLTLQRWALKGIGAQQAAFPPCQKKTTRAVPATAAAATALACRPPLSRRRPDVPSLQLRDLHCLQALSMRHMCAGRALVACAPQVAPQRKPLDPGHAPRLPAARRPPARTCRQEGLPEDVQQPVHLLQQDGPNLGGLVGGAGARAARLPSPGRGWDGCR